MLAPALTLTGCLGPALQEHATNNGAFEVEYLFSHDGCRVYRFRDSGAHYFVRCDGPGPAVHSSTTQKVSCGKNCVREEDIPTALAK
jgi:hypothetical protein